MGVFFYFYYYYYKSVDDLPSLLFFIWYVHLQSASLVGSTGCPLASWTSQIYWLRSSRCASVWSKAWISTTSTDHQTLWTKPRRGCVSSCCADIHGNCLLWQTWSSLIKECIFNVLLVSFFSLSLSLFRSERCWFLTISGTTQCWRLLISTVGYFWPPETEASQTVSVVCWQDFTH